MCGSRVPRRLRLGPLRRRIFLAGMIAVDVLAVDVFAVNVLMKRKILFYDS